MTDEAGGSNHDDQRQPEAVRRLGHNKRLVFDALERLVESGALTAAAKTNHGFREAVRRILGGMPARALSRRWPELRGHSREHLADAYVAEVLRPKLGKPLANRRNDRIGYQLTLRQAVELLGLARRILDRDQLRLLLASDAAYGEYLTPWALPMLAAPSLELYDFGTVLADGDDDGEAMTPIVDAVEQLLNGQEPGPIADLPVADVHLHDHGELGGNAGGDVGGEADPSMLQALAGGHVQDLIGTQVEAVQTELARLLDHVADPARIIIDDLDLLTVELDKALEALHATAEETLAALVELTPAAASPAPETLGALITQLEEVGPALLGQQEAAVAIAQLRRLASVSALSDAAASAAAAFAAAAVDAIDGGGAAGHPLLTVVEILDRPTVDLDFGVFYGETLPYLAQALPNELQPYLGLLTSGLLELPPADLKSAHPADGADLADRRSGRPAEGAGTDHRQFGAPDTDAGVEDGHDGVRAGGAADDDGLHPEVAAPSESSALAAQTAPAAAGTVTSADLEVGVGAAVNAATTTAPAQAERAPASAIIESSPATGPDPAAPLDAPLPATGTVPPAPTCQITEATLAAPSATVGGHTGTAEASDEPADTRADPATVETGDATSASGLSDDQVEDTLATTIEAGRWAAAYWVARAAGLNQTRTDTLELAAYAMQMRRLDGPLTAPFADTLARLEPQLDTAMRSPLDRTLLIGGAVRAALISPYAGAMALSSLTRHIGAAPATTALVDAVTQAAQAGVRVGSDAPAYVRAGTDHDDPLAEFADQASAMLRDAPKQKVAFQAASDLWHDWMRREGRLGRLLHSVASGQTGRAGQVAADAARLRKGLQAAIVDDDRRKRGNIADRNAIRFTARLQLLHKADEVLSLVDAWAETVAEADHIATQGWEQQRLDALREAITAYRDGMRAELAAGCQDSAAACRVVAVVGDQLDRMFDRLVAGDLLRGPEPSPHVARNVALLKVVDLALDTDTLEPLPDEPVTAALLGQLAADRSWEDAFAARADAGYHDETTAILGQIAGDPAAGGEARAEHLAEQREAAMQAAQAAAERRWQEVRQHVETARVHGVLDTRTAANLSARLQAARPHSGRLDIGRIGRELEEFDTEIAAASEAAADLALLELEVASEHDVHVAAYADAVRERIEAGDLAVAHDLLLRLKRGDRPDEDRPYEPEFNGRFSTALADRAEVRFDRDVVQLVSDGGQWGVIDYSGLPEVVRDRAAKAAQAWVKMADNKGAVTPTNLSATLTALGLPVRNADQMIETVKGGSVQHVWRQITVTDEVASPAPQFGSDTRSRFRLLVTWDGITPGKLVNLAVTQGNRRPVVCLHLGTFGPAQRRELSELCRPDQHNAQVVVIDGTLFGYRLSLNDDQWTATMRLALPYSAVNPYVPDAPELPPEMFFGRRDELGQILDPRGTCVLYGGRKLGKSALMRQAARLFDAEGDHAVAVYLDVKNHNIGFGTKATADQLWPVLHQALVDAGVPLADAGTDVDACRKAVRDGLLAWIADKPQREVLILLDECDRLLDADAKADEVNPFPVVRGLYELAQASDRRVKPVFAGLHQVQRFQRLPNQPFAHLGRAIAIGGLDPKAAYDLIHQPLTALGCRFESRHVVSRVLAYTNYHPALLQVFGSELVRHLLKRPRQSDPPYLVTMDDVEQVMQDERTEKAIRDKFVDTINLDRRYELIAYTLALHDHDRGYGTLVAPAELRVLCEQWRSDANQVLPTDDRAGETFRRLLDEMVDLGVLAPPVNGRYAMRSPVVTQLLGDEDRLLELLSGFTGTIETTVDPAHDRRLISGTDRRAYPLTERQLDALIQPDDSFQLLLSTEALGGGDLDAALIQVAAGRSDVEHRSFPQLSKRATPKLPMPKSRAHRLLVCDVRGQTPEKLDHALVNAQRLLDEQHLGTVSAVVHADADQLGLWRKAAAGQVVGDRDVPTTVPHRWSADGIRLWAQRVELTLGAGDLDRVVAATGGWPVLLDAAVAHLPAFGGSLPAAAEDVRAQLDGADGARRFVTQTGLERLDGQELAAWEQLLLWADIDPADVNDLARVIAEETGEPTRSRVAQVTISLAVLELLGVAVRTGDGKLAPEPVVAAAWRAVSAPEPA